jgi:hypothetical protein
MEGGCRSGGSQGRPDAPRGSVVGQAVLTLPFLTLSDPVTAGEGALDPLGLSMIGERLAPDSARFARPYVAPSISHGLGSLRGGM